MNKLFARLVLGAALLATPALADPVDLPIRHCYGDPDILFFIDKTGVNYVDGSCVAQTRQKGLTFKLLCFSPTNEAGTWETFTLKENLQQATLTFVRGKERPEIVKRCPVLEEGK